MRTTMISLIAILALAAGAAGAQDMPGMKGMKTAPAVAVKTGKATGVIKALDAKAGTVTLQHGPILGLGWPAMTMVFKAAPPTMLKGLKVGQTVDSDVRTPPTGPEVTAFRPH